MRVVQGTSERKLAQRSSRICCSHIFSKMSGGEHRLFYSGGFLSRFFFFRFFRKITQSSKVKIKRNKLRFHGCGATPKIDSLHPYELSTQLSRRISVTFFRCLTSLQEDDIVVEGQDEMEQTPLLYAARNGSLKIVEMLLATGQVDVNCPDDENCTALHASIGGFYFRACVCGTLVNFLCFIRPLVYFTEGLLFNPYTAAHQGGAESVVVRHRQCWCELTRRWELQRTSWIDRWFYFKLCVRVFMWQKVFYSWISCIYSSACSSRGMARVATLIVFLERLAQAASLNGVQRWPNRWVL